MTQNFIRIAQGIVWPADIALPLRRCVSISKL